MVHLFQPCSENIEEEEIRDCEMQVAYNSDDRLFIEFYRYEGDKRVTEKQVVFDQKETRQLARFISELGTRVML
ncbi:MAG: hypothetical protein ABEK04_03445 [Candidatus Nanohalobium sp.]